MSHILRIIAITVAALLSWNTSFGEVFNTSKSFDLLCAPQYIDHLKGEPRFADLLADSAFMADIADINANCSASKLCNLYSEIKGDKNDLTKCMSAITSLDSIARGIEWAEGILSVGPQLASALQRLVDNGYSEYWDTTVYPRLKSHIDNYHLNQKLMDAITDGIAHFSYPEPVADTQSSIIVLDIENAFNLSDESFCCTPLILDPEIERQLRLNFMNIYIHENLHNLHLSPALMAKLEQLDADPFYNSNESIASGHGEGRNEAFVVAAEVYLSHKLGIRDSQNVFDEFSQYVDGSLVLAPIIYVNLSRRFHDESYNDFLLRLFDDGTLAPGAIEDNYRQAMNDIKSQIGM